MVSVSPLRFMRSEATPDGTRNLLYAGICLDEVLFLFVGDFLVRQERVGRILQAFQYPTKEFRVQVEWYSVTEDDEGVKMITPASNREVISPEGVEKAVTQVVPLPGIYLKEMKRLAENTYPPRRYYCYRGKLEPLLDDKYADLKDLIRWRSRVRDTPAAAEETKEVTKKTGKKKSAKLAKKKGATKAKTAKKKASARAKPKHKVASAKQPKRKVQEESNEEEYNDVELDESQSDSEEAFVDEDYESNEEVATPLSEDEDTDGDDDDEKVKIRPKKRAKTKRSDKVAKLLAKDRHVRISDEKPLYVERKRGSLKLGRRFYHEVRLDALTGSGRWTVRAGDLLAIATDESDHIDSSHTYPWSPVHVICIYQEPGSEELLIQYRWLYFADEMDCFEELTLPDDLHEESVIEIDEAHGTAPINSVLGNVSLHASSRVPVQQSKGGGMPTKPLFCPYFYSSKLMKPSLDHTTEKWFDGVQMRNLTCEKGFPGKNEDLLRKYCIAMVQFYPELQPLLPQEHTKNPGDDGNEEMKAWPGITLEARNITPGPVRCELTSQKMTFYESIEVPFESRRFSERVKGRDFTVRPGNFVCIGLARSSLEPEFWAPLKGPFRIAQVILMYSRDGQDSLVLLQVRWLSRRATMSRRLESRMPPDIGDWILTDEFQDNVNAKLVVGLWGCLGMNAMESPFRYKFYRDLELFQPTHDHSESALLDQSLSASSFTKKYKELRSTKSSERVAEPMDLTRDILITTSEGIDLYASIQVKPLWGSFVSPDELCVESCRGSLSWRLYPGDIVAVADPEGSLRKSVFAVSWRVGQVSCLHSKQGEDDTWVELRPLFTHADVYTGHSRSDASCGILYESAVKADHSTVSVRQILAPLALLPLQSRRHSSHVRKLWNTFPKFLPMLQYMYGGEYDPVQQRRSGNPRTTVERLARLTKRGIEAASFAEQFRLEDVTQSLRDTLRVRENEFLQIQQRLMLANKMDRSALNAEEESVVWVTDLPFYVDLSDDIEFFNEINLQPQSNTVVDSLKGTVQDAGVWTVRVGDPVIIQYKTSAGGTAFGAASGIKNTNRYFPLSLPWAVAEIVSIFRPNKGHKDKVFASPESTFDGDNEDTEGILLEVRWFFRVKELPQSFQKKFNAEGCEMEEIFESDWYDIVSPRSVLAPAHLHAEQEATEATFQHGLPLLQFVCSKYWAQKRKGLLPTNGLDGRVRRAQANSRFFGKSRNLREAYDNLTTKKTIEEVEGAEDTNWRTAYDKVVQCLRLTDASMRGFDTSTTLVGREKEQAKIYDFLRNAMTSGRAGEKCMFIAGPPGGGKTASVKVAIERLRQEADRGAMSSFEFVAMNCFDFREPSEAYVHFWESISDDKISATKNVAVRSLQHFFDKSTEERNIILLLDEVDYLVDKSQKVLMDFFDWPLAQSPHVNFVVVGISNTINLVDRLMHRIQSRIGHYRVRFDAYKHEQIQAILQSKLKRASPRFTVFSPDAVVLAARKIQRQSGDIRTAFKLCRMAATMKMAQLVKDDTQNLQVTTADMVKSMNECFSSPQAKRVSLCTAFQLLVLISLGALYLQNSDKDEFTMEDIRNKVKFISEAYGDADLLPVLSLDEIVQILYRMRDERMVSIRVPKCSFGYIDYLVRRHVEDDNILAGLKGNKYEKMARRFLIRPL